MQHRHPRPGCGAHQHVRPEPGPLGLRQDPIHQPDGRAGAAPVPHPLPGRDLPHPGGNQPAQAGHQAGQPQGHRSRRGAGARDQGVRTPGAVAVQLRLGHFAGRQADAPQAAHGQRRLHEPDHGRGGLQPHAQQGGVRHLHRALRQGPVQAEADQEQHRQRTLGRDRGPDPGQSADVRCAQQTVRRCQDRRRAHGHAQHRLRQALLLRLRAQLGPQVQPLGRADVPGPHQHRQPPVAGTAGRSPGEPGRHHQRQQETGDQQEHLHPAQRVPAALRSQGRALPGAPGDPEARDDRTQLQGPEARRRLRLHRRQPRGDGAAHLPRHQAGRGLGRGLRPDAGTGQALGQAGQVHRGRGVGCDASRPGRGPAFLQRRFQLQERAHDPGHRPRLQEQHHHQEVLRGRDRVPAWRDPERELARQHGGELQHRHHDRLPQRAGTLRQAAPADPGRWPALGGAPPQRGLPQRGERPARFQPGGDRRGRRGEHEHRQAVAQELQVPDVHHQAPHRNGTAFSHRAADQLRAVAGRQGLQGVHGQHLRVAAFRGGHRYQPACPQVAVPQRPLRVQRR